MNSDEPEQGYLSGAYRLTVLKRLRQPRYAALSALMLALALICVAAGTWQVARFREKVHENRVLRANAHAAAVPVQDVLPVYPETPNDPNAVKFRTVTAMGTYTGSTQLVRRQTVDVAQSDTEDVSTQTGYLVLSPFRTATATLLVVRGFVAEPTDGSVPRTPAPPAGSLTITGRAMPASTADDHATQLTADQVDSVNAAQQAGRLNVPVYSGYAALLAGEPGTAGLATFPSPDLSNPAGGAYAWQHLAYVLQWYLFAILALAAPLLISRHETRLAQREFLGIDPDAVPARREPADSGTDGESGALVTRERGEVAIQRSPAEQRYVDRATRMADRYGYRLEVPDAPLADLVAEPEPETPTHDAYHGSYNDYLWQLAIADEQEKNDKP
jgi:cytochrome oxidase assembly protein ShyY1